MRTRTLVAAALLPWGLVGCGGAGVEEFCAQYAALDRLEEPDAGQLKERLEELARAVPDEAGDDVREAVEFMAGFLPPDGDLRRAFDGGDVSEEDAEKFLTAAGTVTGYGDETCGG